MPQCPGPGIVVNVTRGDRHRFEAIVSDRCAPQKHVWRAQIILATADGCGTTEIMRRSTKAKPVVWTWQARFMAEGVDGLLRYKTRKPGKPPLPADTVQLVVNLVTGPPPGEATHWTGRILAKAAGISLRSVQRILEAHQLAPHRIRTSSCRTTRSSPRSSEKWSAFMSTLPVECSTAEALLIKGELYIMNPDGSKPIRLTNDGFSDALPALSPDGKGKIVFDSNRIAGFRLDILRFDSDLFLINADGTGLAATIKPTPTTALSPPGIGDH